MANNNQPVEQIQQRLTCPICLDRYKQPKLLPCQHTFCLAPCLISLADRQTGRIKCPECRQLHLIPVNGVESFPNNITIMGFLDLDFTNMNNRPHTAVPPDKCANCLQRRNDLTKCLDCSKFFCADCNLSHVIDLKTETKQSISNLRRAIPKLSEKVGNFEQRQTVAKTTFESIKHDVSLIVDKLIDELRNRERSLHAECEVYMESQLRTFGLEKENAEIELASISSFCDSCETTLNRPDQPQGNEIALLKKQAIAFLDEMKTLNTNVNTNVNSLKFAVPNLNELFTLIQNFGELMTQHRNTNYDGGSPSANQVNRNQPNQNQNQNNNYNNQNNQNAINNHNQNQRNQQQQQQQQLNNDQRPQQDFRRRRQQWDRHNRDFDYDANNTYGGFMQNNHNNTNNNNNNNNHANNNNNANNNTVPPPNQIRPTPRSIFGPNPFAPNSANNAANANNPNNNANNNHQARNTERQQSNPNPANGRNQTNPPPRPRSRPLFGGFGSPRSADNRYDRNDRNDNNANDQNRPRLIRSDTFELDNPNDEAPRVRNPNTNNVDVNDLYNVRRRPRARSPLAFAVMLNESENINFDEPTNSTILREPLLNDPSVNYAAKTRAKQIIGKQGRENGEFVWPIGVAINPIGKNMLISDSNNHRIQIFEPNGRFLKTLGSQGNRDGHFECVSDVAVDSMGNIYVVDRHNHRIQVFDRYSRFIRKIGHGPGSAPGELNFPWGVAVNRFSEIFVCDKENNRVCVFHLTGRFLRAFGLPGNRPGQFDKPYYVHVTNDNKVLVSDCSNHRIQVFDPQGNVLHCIGREGREPGQFKHPRGICTDSEGFILVADSGNSRIQVLRPDGSFVCEFGSAGTESGKFKGIEGITISPTGDVIVCDKENHRVQVL